MTYVDRQGRRISRTIWLALSARPDYVVVASDSVAVGVEQAEVITIWLGMLLPGSDPAVFETLLQYSGDTKPHRWLSSTLAQARRSHAQVVEYLSHDPRALAAWLVRNGGTAAPRGNLQRFGIPPLRRDYPSSGAP